MLMLEGFPRNGVTVVEALRLAVWIHVGGIVGRFIVFYSLAVRAQHAILRVRDNVKHCNSAFRQ